MVGMLAPCWFYRACLLVNSLGVQAYGSWQALGSWISQNEPDFGPGVKERFANASKTSAEQVQHL